MSVLYRKYRPESFEEIVGQDQIVKVLTATVKKGTPAHAYLFTGSRGTGKTSTARILAKTLNISPEIAENLDQDKKLASRNAKLIKTGEFLDIIEIDAASNRGVAEIRDLRERVAFAPAQGFYKVYIIDEVHMLTTEAFNALLKTLEEPPAQTVFIMATTEVHKLPNTILSRVVRFDFKLASKAEIKQKLTKIAEAESVELTNNTLDLIVKLARGSFRDSESLLEKLINNFDVGSGSSDTQKNSKTNLKSIEVDVAADILGTSLPADIQNLIAAISEGDTVDYPKIVKQLDKILATGTNPQQFIQDLIDQLVEIIEQKISGTKQYKQFDLKRLFKLSALVQRLLKQLDSYLDPVTAIKLEFISEFVDFYQPDSISDLHEDKQLNQKTQFTQDIPRSELNPKSKPVSKSIEKKTVNSDLELNSKLQAQSVNQDSDKLSAQAIWNKFLMIIKNEDRRLGGMLDKAKLSDQPSVFSIAVPYKFHKLQLDKPDMKRKILAKLNQIAGTDKSIEIVYDDGLKASSSESHLNTDDLNSSEINRNNGNKDNSEVVEDIFSEFIGS